MSRDFGWGAYTGFFIGIVATLLDRDILAGIMIAGVVTPFFLLVGGGVVWAIRYRRETKRMVSGGSER